MSTVRVEETKVIEATAAEIYNVVGDYVDGHHRIMPKKYFPELVVEKGGQGVGTIVRVTSNFMGQKQTLRMEVIEAEPGRWILEKDADKGLIYTSYKFEPLDEDQQTRLTIATEATLSPGFKGWIEKLMYPRLLRTAYKAELQQITEYFQANSPVASTK